MKRIIFILLSISTLLTGFKDANIDTNSKVKAIFILNFAKLIEWPEPYQKGDFNIGIIGESPLYNELKRMAGTKKVANQKINVENIKLIKDIKKYHILYVSQEKSDQLSKIVEEIEKNSTLIITEKEGLIDSRGVGINFIVRGNRQKFELNTTNIKRSKLKISSNLKALSFKEN